MIGVYYELIYAVIVILFAIPVLSRYSNGWTIYDVNRDREPIHRSLVFAIIIILFVGFRPNSSVFCDGPGYWTYISNHVWEQVSVNQVNYQFATWWLIRFMSSNNFTPRLGFFVYTIIIYGGAYVALRKLYPSDTLLAMILYCGTFGVFACAVNAIKNGMALSMFLCALAYKDKRIVCLIFLALSFGFHHSLEISIAAFLLCLVYKKTNHYYKLWFVCFLMAAMHISFFQTLFAGLTDDHGATYLITNEDSMGMTGFRPDFIAYCAAPLALGWWVKSKIDIKGTLYSFYLNVYLVMNSIWLLCMYASFTNRIAALSWYIFPLLILEPLLKNRISSNQHKILFWYVVGQLTFTLLMSIIYISKNKELYMMFG